MITNTIAGLVSILNADAELTALVGTRVFGFRLPKTEAANMPRKAVVISPAGGTDAGGFLPYRTLRLDIFCYGETAFESDKVSREVNNTMYNLPRTKNGDRLIFNAQQESGPNFAVDPDTDWPVSWETWAVTASKVAVA